jgi:DNA polymerase-3 subunit epsilon
MKHFYCDTETTGTDNKTSGLINIAGIIEIDGKVEEEVNLFTRPFPSDIIDPAAMAVNKLDLTDPKFIAPADAKVQFCKVLSKYCDKFNRQDKFFFHAFNAKFDWDMLWSWFAKCNDKYFGSWFFFPPLDIATMAGYKLQFMRHQMENFKLHTVAKALNIDTSKYEAHNALDDIRLAQEIEIACHKI